MGRGFSRVSSFSGPWRSRAPCGRGFSGGNGGSSVKQWSVVLALAAALLLRLGFALVYWVDKPLTHDEREYLELAENLAAGRGFTYTDTPGPPERFGRAPLYPLFLAGVMNVSGTAATPVDRRLTAVKIAQALVGTVGVWLIGLLAIAVGGESIRSIALWLAAVYPPLIWICAYVLSEALYSAVLLGGAVLLARGLERGASVSSRSDAGSGAVRRRDTGTRSAGGLLFASGLVGGLAALTRPPALFFLAFAGAWLVRRVGARPAAAFTLGALLAIGPWTVRNVREHGRFVLIASEGGVTFWTGNHPLARGEGDLAANPDLKRANLEFRRRHAGLSTEALEPLYYREALSYIAGHPVAWAVLTVKKFFYLWVPIGPSYRLHSARYFWASVVSYGTILALAIAGWARRRILDKPRANTRHEDAPLGLLLWSAVATCLVFFPQERFRIPVIDPVLIVGAAFGLASGWSIQRRARIE